jgi:YD repeat-containing protein
MKKLISILATFLLFNSLGIAQTKKSDWTKMDLKGKVKSINEISYITDSVKQNVTTSVFNENGYLIEESTSSGRGTNKFTYKYDDKGLLIEAPEKQNGGTYTYKYNDKGYLIEDVLLIKGTIKILGMKELDKVYKSTYSYDEKGYCIEKKFYTSDKSRFEETGTIAFKYDDKGHMIEKNEYKPNGHTIQTITYKYDDKGRQTEWNELKSNGSLKSTFTYKYDDKGNLIEEPNSDGWKYLYTLDEKGNKIEINTYNQNGKLIWKHLYKYDNNRDLIEKKTYKPNGSLLDNITYTYKYDFDKNLNWIEIAEFWNGVQAKSTKREIVYF